MLIKLEEEEAMHVLKEMEKKFLFSRCTVWLKCCVQHPPTTRKPGPKNKLKLLYVNAYESLNEETHVLFLLL